MSEEFKQKPETSINPTITPIISQLGLIFAGANSYDTNTTISTIGNYLKEIRDQPDADPQLQSFIGEMVSNIPKTEAVQRVADVFSDLHSIISSQYGNSESEKEYRLKLLNQKIQEYQTETSYDEQHARRYIEDNAIYLNRAQKQVLDLADEINSFSTRTEKNTVYKATAILNQATAKKEPTRQEAIDKQPPIPNDDQNYDKLALELYKTFKSMPQASPEEILMATQDKIGKSDIKIARIRSFINSYESFLNDNSPSDRIQQAYSMVNNYDGFKTSILEYVDNNGLRNIIFDQQQYLTNFTDTITTTLNFLLDRLKTSRDAIPQLINDLSTSD